MKVSADALELVSQNQQSDNKKTGEKQVEAIGFRKMQPIGITYETYRGSADEIGFYDDSQRTTMSEVRAMAENTDIKTIRTSLGLLSNHISATDVKGILKQGYPVGEMQVDSIVTVTDKIKINLAAHCKDYKVVGDAVDAAEAEEVTGSVSLANRIAKKFKEANLPETKENLSDSVSAIKMAKSIPNLSEGAIKYMVTNQLPPTIENVYRAEYSVDTPGTGGSYGVGYFTQGTGYYGKTTADYNWGELKNQMGKVIEEAGLPITDDTLSDARWLVQNNIPLTKDTLSSYQALQNLTLPLKENSILQSITNALQEGKRPSQALLTKTESVYTRALKAFEIIQNTSEEEIKNLLQKNQVVNITNLGALQAGIEAKVQAGDGVTKAQNGIAADSLGKITRGAEIDSLGKITAGAEIGSLTAGAETGSLGRIVAGAATGSLGRIPSGAEIDSLAAGVKLQSEDQAGFLTAKRQLEEIRLKMTAETNVRMIKQGISLETEPLSKLVDALKQAEKSIQKDLFSGAGVAASEENGLLYTDTLRKADALRSVPSYILGSVFAGKTKFSIEGLYTDGGALQSKLDRAGERYEVLMTTPRKDMGDSIKKAFQNVEDILIDMGLETTQANQRAVRILGYNGMEITKENIQTIKEADASVNQLFKNLTPTVTLSLIREGKNPLNQNIDELNQAISEQKEESDSTNSEEKYSKFLYQLEHNHAITKQERKTYVGMYRLLNQIEKSDGSVIGALLNQNADITLNNLLSAIRTSKSKGMDIVVDESFGGLQELTYQSTRISDQLEASFGKGNPAEGIGKDSLAYLKTLPKRALDQISPGKLQSLFSNGEIIDMSLEQFVEGLEYAEESPYEEQSYAEDQKEILKRASLTEDSVIQVLQRYDQPITVNNLLAASELFNSKGGIYKKIESVLENGEEGGGEAYLQTADSLTESLTSKEEMQKAVAQMQAAANEVLNKASEANDISSEQLKEIRFLRKEIQLSTQLAKEERYQIPVQINGELTALHLTIRQGEEAQSKVTVTLDNDSMGKVAAHFSVTGQTVEGYIATDQSPSVESLNNSEEQFAAQLEQSGLSLKTVQFIKTGSLDLLGFEEKSLWKNEAGNNQKLGSAQKVGNSQEAGNSQKIGNSQEARNDQKAGDSQKAEKAPAANTKDCYLVAKAFIHAIKSL